MSMVINCDRCGRVLRRDAGDDWFWAGDEQEQVVCSVCDPEGCAADKMKAAQARMRLTDRFRKAELWDGLYGRR